MPGVEAILRMTNEEFGQWCVWLVNNAHVAHNRELLAGLKALGRELVVMNVGADMRWYALKHYFTIVLHEGFNVRQGYQAIINLVNNNPAFLATRYGV